MHSLYREYDDIKISLAYFGILSDEITEILIELSENYISKAENLSKIGNKTSFLIAESFQNLIRHSVVEKDSITEIQYNRDFFQINIFEDRIAISSANVLQNIYVARFQKRIKHINSLDDKGLRMLKKETLEYGDMSEKGGAGLGLIEMVRKSGLPLVSKFLPLSDGYSLVILNIEIPLHSELKEHKTNIQSVEEVYKKLVDYNILILYKGDFSSNSNSVIIQMLHNNFVRQNDIQSKKIKNIIAIIEVMQNASKHGAVVDGSKDGIFTLSNIEDEVYIECSNLIKQEDYEKLKEILMAIKCCSKKELEMNYKEKLRNSYLSIDGDGGLGLYEIARLTDNTFTYGFEEIEGKEILYSMKLKIE